MRIRTTRRAGRGFVALTLAGGLLLTGCSGGDDGGKEKADSAKGHSGGVQDGAPLPAPAHPSAGTGTGGDAATPEEHQGDEKREVAPAPDYLSTFALDVDTASYGYARRTLADGRLPDPATVRPEEFVNSFRQDYPRPDGDGFSVTVDGARAGTGTDSREDGGDWSLLRVGLATGPDTSDADRPPVSRHRPSKEVAPLPSRPPAALTFVIDVSGSMSEPGRLDLVKRSLDTMTDQLRPDDSVALVTFSDEAETILPMTRLGGRRVHAEGAGSEDGYRLKAAPADRSYAEDSNRARVHEAIDTLEPTDSTNLEAGVTTGYETATLGLREGATNRVVLLSDALANTGETRADAILDRIADARRTHGITLFGVGVGSDYGDALMERLADKGDGHTTYVSSDEDARKVFCEQLPAHIELRARDAKAQVAFDPRAVVNFHLIGYDNRQVADDDFRDDTVDGGEVGPGHTVTALYAVRLRPGASGRLATASVRWLDPDSRAPHEESQSIEADAVRHGVWDGSTPRGLRVAATAAYFANALRSGDSRWNGLPGALPLGELAARARELEDGSGGGDVRRLADAIEQANRLKG
ncbi:YfbK domain-containing protein [Actinomycetota bacterium Odt1-20B]